MNNTFSISRFWHLLKLSLVLQRGFVLKIFGGFVLAIFMLLMFFMVGGISLERQLNSDLSTVYLHVSMGVCQVFYLFCMTIGSCLMFGKPQSFHNRLRLMMMPSSNLEKFIVRWVEVIVIGTILYFLAFIVADLLRMVVLPLLTGEHWGFTLSTLFQPDGTNMSTSELREAEPESYNIGYSIGTSMKHYVINRGMLLAANLTFGLIFVQSIYMLFGVLFTKYSWLFASVLIFAVSVVVFSIPMGWAWMELIALIVLDILIYILTYVLFKRMPLINNKLLNL